MNKGTPSSDGKPRSNVNISFRVGTEEIVGCVEFAYAHGGMNYQGNATLGTAIEEFLTFNTKAEIIECVQKVLEEYGLSYDQRNWDNDLDDDARKTYEAVAAQRFKRELLL